MVSILSHLVARRQRATHLAVFDPAPLPVPLLSLSGLALLRTFRKSTTRTRMRECMYAFEHLMW